MNPHSRAQHPDLPLRGGDALLIVPPLFVVTEPCLAVHVLQACAREAGFRVSVLYANIALASVLGLDNYAAISFPTDYPPRAMLGERLFARSAHGMPALGLCADRMLDLTTALGEARAGQLWAARAFGTQELELTLAELEALEDHASAWVGEITAAISSFGFKLVGCSTIFAQTNASLALLKGVKQCHPQTTTVLGGANCRGDMAQGIASLDPHGDYIDYIFSGESEVTLVKFLGDVLSGQMPPGRIVLGAPCQDLDALPPLDYSEYLAQLEHYLPEVGTDSKDIALLYEGSRGCWWGQKHQCTFCGINGQSISFREKTAERVMRDFRTFVETQPARHILMVDSIMPRAYFETLLPQLAKAQLPLSLSYAQKANLSLSNVLALKNAGVSLIEPGIESLSSALLQRMRKGVRARHNLRLLRYARAVGLDLAWIILWGFPNDEVPDYEQMLALLPLIHHLPPPGAFLHLSMDRFSPYFEHPEEYGIHSITPLGSYRTAFPASADVEKLAYHFVAGYPCASHQHMDVIEALAQEIATWQERWAADVASPAVLHVVPAGDRYLLLDARGLTRTQAMQVLDHEQASVALTERSHVERPEVAWALENKIGAIVDDRYVPLATADPELLQAFEDGVRHGRGGRPR